MASYLNFITLIWDKGNVGLQRFFEAKPDHTKHTSWHDNKKQFYPTAGLY